MWPEYWPTALLYDPDLQIEHVVEAPAMRRIAVGGIPKKDAETCHSAEIGKAAYKQWNTLLYNYLAKWMASKCAFLASMHQGRIEPVEPNFPAVHAMQKDTPEISLISQLNWLWKENNHFVHWLHLCDFVPKKRHALDSKIPNQANFMSSVVQVPVILLYVPDEQSWQTEEPAGQCNKISISNQALCA